MGGWGNSAGGSFWDDEPDGGGQTSTKSDYIQVTTQSDGNAGGETELTKMPNPFDTFEEEEDV